MQPTTSPPFFLLLACPGPRLGRVNRHEDSEKYRTIPRLETLLEPVKEFLSLPDNNFTVNLTAAKMRLAQSSDAYSGCYA